MSDTTGLYCPEGLRGIPPTLPQYVPNWVRRHTEASASREDLKDWTQDLLLHLRYLPRNSRRRDAGKEDMIQTFDPVKHFGAKEARFQNYINLCLTINSGLHSKRMQDALSQPGNMSLDTQNLLAVTGVVDVVVAFGMVLFVRIHVHVVRLDLAVFADDRAAVAPRPPDFDVLPDRRLAVRHGLLCANRRPDEFMRQDYLSEGLGRGANC